MRALFTALVLAAPGRALAHAGDHAAPEGGAIAHALTAPDHALTLFVVIAMPVALWLWLRRQG